MGKQVLFRFKGDSIYKATNSKGVHIKDEKSLLLTISFINELADMLQKDNNFYKNFTIMDHVCNYIPDQDRDSYPYDVVADIGGYRISKGLQNGELFISTIGGDILCVALDLITKLDEMYPNGIIPVEDGEPLQTLTMGKRPSKLSTLSSSNLFGTKLESLPQPYLSKEQQERLKKFMDDEGISKEQLLKYLKE